MWSAVSLGDLSNVAQLLQSPSGLAGSYVCNFTSIGINAAYDTRWQPHTVLSRLVALRRAS